MSLSLIKKPTEIVSKKTIAALIYGQSGVGKSSLACSAPSPVMFDFDGGIGRIRDDFQVPTVQITKWQDAIDALEEVSKDGGYFRTVIIDTVDKMIDSIITHICGMAQPRLQHWGLINATFKNFIRSVQSLGKNIILVAQREVEKNGEEIRYVPQIRASNYKVVICDLDICGYIEIVSYQGREVRQITFNPSCRSEGKNTADFDPSYIIPDLKVGEPNTFFTDRFAEYVAKQNEKAARRAETAKAVEQKLNDYTTLFAEVTTAEELNAVCLNIKNEKPIGDLILRLRQMVRTRAEELGLTLNKEDRRYE